ncbi:MAG: hypothetical protein ABIH23_26405 [bacterium]
MFDPEECDRHCPNRMNSATGRWLDLALAEIEWLRKKIGREPTFFYRGCVAHAGYKFYANGEITWKPTEQYALASKGEEPSAEPPTTAPIGSGTSPAVGEAAG